jgi:peptide/nickel transport system permease protein
MMHPVLQSLRRVLASPIAALAVAVAGVLVLGALGAPWWTPQNPFDLQALDLSNANLPPMSRSSGGVLFALGSDDQGRDILSAIFYGLRISIAVGIISAVIAIGIGTLIGLVSGYVGGRLDALTMRLVDFQLSFPVIMVALVLLAVLGRGPDKVIIALVVVQWAYFARIVRASALAERQRDYIAAARGLRIGHLRILFRHLLPNCLPALIVVATVQVAGAIALEATLSFLGIGMPVGTPSLGLLIANGFQYLFSGAFWISVFPGLVLMLLIVSINLIGDRVRVVLDPKGLG